MKLSATSFRIQPQQTYYVFYEANAPQSTWFLICVFSDLPSARRRMNVRLQLPHTVYLLPKRQVEKPEVRVERAELNALENKVVLEVENTGNNFGRVLQTQLLYSRRKDAPGFPIFPHSKRILEVPLDVKAEGENVPVEVSLQFQNFKVEEKLQRKKDPEPAVVSGLSSAEGNIGKNP